MDGPTLRELGLNRGRRGLVVLVYLVALIVVGPACGPRQPVGILEREVGGEAVLLVNRPVPVIGPADRLIGIEVGVFLLPLLDLLGGEVIPICENFSLLVSIRDRVLGHRPYPRAEHGCGILNPPSRIQALAAPGDGHVALPRLRAEVVWQRRRREPCDLQLREIQAGGLVGRAELGEDRGLGGRDGGEAPAGAPGSLRFDGGDDAIVAQVELLGQARGRQRRVESVVEAVGGIEGAAVSAAYELLEHLGLVLGDLLEEGRRA